MADPGYGKQLTKRLVDQGKLMEAGWMALRSNDVLAGQWTGPMLEVSRISYMAGAQHLFASIMAMMDPGVEPSADDLRRMDLIAAELNKFTKELKLRVTRTKGSG